MLTVTEIARKQVVLAMAEEDRDNLALRVAVVGRGPNGFQYKMDLIGTEEREDNDVVVDVGDFQVLVDPESAPRLQGVTVDFITRLSESGFRFENPNSMWDDPLAEKVHQVIDSQINPQIASHGGFITLLDVQDGTAFVSMGGGCQGCGMADVTLKSGVETMILEAVPEIERVLDQTDHAAGTNPYYAGPTP